ERSLGQQISVETRFPLPLPPIRADANQVEMALLNLVVNARDAMPNGGQIILAARSEIVTTDVTDGLKPGQYVRLSVSDTGEGMEGERLARAIEPFFTTKGPDKGPGLGLPMVHGLAEQMGGRFTLKSSRGAGTTAELWLPAAGETTHAAEPKRPLTASPQPGCRPLVILVVDDDELVLTNTIAMLDDLGHTAIAASPAKEALDTLRRETSLDIVISDQVMPQMTGAELAEAIKAEWPKLPVILAFGFAETPVNAGPYARLAKPFTQAELSES